MSFLCGQYLSTDRIIVYVFVIQFCAIAHNFDNRLVRTRVVIRIHKNKRCCKMNTVPSSRRLPPTINVTFSTLPACFTSNAHRYSPAKATLLNFNSTFDSYFEWMCYTTYTRRAKRCMPNQNRRPVNRRPKCALVCTCGRCSCRTCIHHTHDTSELESFSQQYSDRTRHRLISSSYAHSAQSACHTRHALQQPRQRTVAARTLHIARRVLARPIYL
jgi:hypothetical protein